MGLVRFKRFFTKRIVLLLLFSFVYVLILPFYYNKFLTFGCFDDCFNYMGGYFLLQGKTMFSEFFYNHQPFMAYLSYMIQELSDPQGLYHLVLYHRLFTYVTSFVFGLFLIYRFGVPAFLTLFVYESTKHYVFGDRFLAEGIAVYLLIYLFGLIYEAFMKKRILGRGDGILAVLSTYLVVFLREPYIPLAALLCGGVLYFLRSWKRRLVYFGLFLLLSLLTILQFPLSEYYFNVVTVNSVAFLAEDSTFSAVRILTMVFYPLFAVFGKEQTIFGGILQTVSIFFVIISVLFVKQGRKYLLFFFGSLFILGVANLRFTQPGKMYYESFHMIVWYGLFLFLVSSMLSALLGQANRSTLARFSAVYGILLVLGIFSPQSFYFDRHDLQTDFVTHFGQYVSSGEVVKTIATDDTSLFLDGFDDMIYYQSGVPTDYKYGWFTSVMPRFERYMAAREEMFERTPPDFYYGSCHYLPNLVLPKQVEQEYSRFYFREEPTCLFMRKNKEYLMTAEKKTQVERIGFELLEAK